MLQELDPSVVADVTTCVLQYQELDPNVVAGVVADCTTHPFKRAQTDWLFKLFIMPPSRRDRPGQSAHMALYPNVIALAVRISGARCTCDVLSVCVGFRAWNMVPRRR